MICFRCSGSAFAQQDHALAGVAVRSPVPVVLMKADRRRQAVLRSEVIDRASLPVVAGLDRGLGLHVGRQAVIDARHLGHHGFPSKLVGIVLRQRRARVTVLADGRREVNRMYERNKSLRADAPAQAAAGTPDNGISKHQNKGGFQPGAAGCARSTVRRPQHQLRTAWDTPERRSNLCRAEP